MADFENELKQLHDSFVLSDTDNAITITPSREFKLPDTFNTLIAYEGDVNSQIITFVLPASHEGHPLANCSNHELKWTNTSSKIEGISTLTQVTDSENEYKWEVPPEALTQAGNIEISISVYDYKDDKIYFSWNTSTYADLRVGETIGNVRNVYPPKDEILVINTETRNIVAPSGYNNVVCNYGEVGMAEVYFLINNYIGKRYSSTKIDVKDANICVYYSMHDEVLINDNIEQIDYYQQNNNQGQILLVWTVPDTITRNSYGAGQFKISLEITGDGATWYSNVYNGLSVGANPLSQVDPSEEGPFTSILQYTKDKVIEVLNENEFIIDENE